jgi:hypothetical protein
MATPSQIEANRANARRSTGPRTAAGKARSSHNALQHGLRANSALLPGESATEWREHREGVLIALGAKGALETALADRVALILWRMRRIGACDAATVERALPADGCTSSEDNLLDLVMRYEAHLSRQALQALQALERLQNIRERQPAMISLAVEDTMELFDKIQRARYDAKLRAQAAAEEQPVNP